MVQTVALEGLSKTSISSVLILWRGPVLDDRFTKNYAWSTICMFIYTADGQCREAWFEMHVIDTEKIKALGDGATSCCSRAIPQYLTFWSMSFSNHQAREAR